MIIVGIVCEVVVFDDVCEVNEIDEEGYVKNNGEEEEEEEYLADETNAAPGRRSEGQDDGDEPLDRQQSRRPYTQCAKNLEDIAGPTQR